MMFFKKSLKIALMTLSSLLLLTVIIAQEIVLTTAAAQTPDTSISSQARETMQFATKGAAYFFQGKYDKALEQYNKAIVLDDKNANLYRQRAWVYETKKQDDLAIADYKKELELLNAKPARNEEEDVYIAQYYAYNGLYDLTITYADKMIEKDQDLDGYYFRGMAYLQQGKYDLAIADFNTILDMRSEGKKKKLVYSFHEDDLYALRGKAYHGAKQYESALDDMNKIIPTLYKFGKIEPYIERGNIYYDMGKYELALADYNEAIALDLDNKDNDDLLLERGKVYLKLKKYDFALEDCNNILNTDIPIGTSLYFGNVSHEYSQNKKMLKYFYAYSLRAKVYREKGDNTLALADENSANTLIKQINQYYLEKPYLKETLNSRIYRLSASKSLGFLRKPYLEKYQYLRK